MELTTEQLHAIMPLGEHLDIDLRAATPEEVVMAMDWAPETTTAGGAMHGGMLMALADTAGGAVAFLNLPDGAGTSTPPLLPR